MIPLAIDLSARTVWLLGEAEAALGRLDGTVRLLPDPKLVTRPFLLREAIFSTRIEGTRASMADVYEVGAGIDAANADVEEVLGHVDAMQWGLEQRDSLPLCTRLICGMHRRLMAGVRGRDRAPVSCARRRNGSAPPARRSRRRASCRHHRRNCRPC